MRSDIDLLPLDRGRSWCLFSGAVKEMSEFIQTLQDDFAALGRCPGCGTETQDADFIYSKDEEGLPSEFHCQICGYEERF